MGAKERSSIDRRGAEIVVGDADLSSARRYAAWLDAFGTPRAATNGGDLIAVLREGAIDLVVLNGEILDDLDLERRRELQGLLRNVPVLVFASDAADTLSTSHHSRSISTDRLERDELRTNVAQVLRRRRYEALVDEYFERLREHTDSSNADCGPSSAAIEQANVPQRVTELSRELERTIAEFDACDFDAIFRGLNAQRAD
jgi:hypothetical protein